MQLLEFALLRRPISVKCLLKTLLIATGSVISVPSCKIFGILVEFLDLESRLHVDTTPSFLSPAYINCFGKVRVIISNSQRYQTQSRTQSHR